MNRIDHLVDKYVFEDDRLTSEQRDWLLNRLAFLYYPLQEVVEAAMMIPEREQSNDMREALGILSNMEYEIRDAEKDEVPPNLYFMGRK